MDYAAGTNAAGQNGGTGWTGIDGWGPTFGQHVAVASEGLTYKNLAVKGKAVSLPTPTAFGSSLLQRSMWDGVGEPGTTRYWSVLIKPGAVSGGITNANFSVRVGNWDIHYISNSEGTFALGIPGLPYFASSVTPAAGQTYFLVVRATYTTGTDAAELFINPTPGQPLPATPSAGGSLPHPLDIVSTPLLVKFESFSPVVVDEIRVGTSWSAVSPTTP